MTRWNELSPGTRSWIMMFIVVMIVLAILAVFGYYNGNWDGTDPDKAGSRLPEPTQRLGAMFEVFNVQKA